MVQCQPKTYLKTYLSKILRKDYFLCSNCSHSWFLLALLKISLKAWKILCYIISMMWYKEACHFMFPHKAIQYNTIRPHKAYLEFIDSAGEG